MLFDHTPDDLELLDVADRLSRARAGLPSPTRSDQALTNLMSEVGMQRMAPAPTGLAAILASFAAGPMWRTGLAVVAALFVVGGAGFGVAAATGNEPVRGLLGISNSVIGVEFEGVVVDVQPGALRIDANGDLRIVTVDANTDITRSGEVVAFDAIAPAMTVEVHGRLLSDNTILATRVNLEDDPDASPTVGTPTEAVPTEAAPTAPAAVPTVDDDDEDADEDDENDDADDDEDNSGAGNADDNDDGDNEDNSGPGNGDDDSDNDDNSGPGNGDDDGDNEDRDDDRSGANSGPGGGDEEDDGGGDEDGGGSGSGGDDD